MTPGVQKRSVAVLAYDGLCTFEFALAVEIFGLRRPELGVPWYDFKICAAAPGPLRAEGGVSLHARYGLRALESAGTVVVPGWRHELDEPPPALIASLRRAHARGARLISICSGAFVLAATGLLDVRSPEHFRRGHIGGAVNLPHARITERALEAWPPGTLFVVYCDGVHCNGADRGALRLSSLGRPVKKMVGGVAGWIADGFPLVEGPG